MSPVAERIRAAIAPGLSPQQRRDILENVARDLGLEARTWSSWVPAWVSRFSVYAGTLGRLFISRGVEESAAGADWGNEATEAGEVDLLATLAHELTHAARAEARGAFLWRALYLLWPPFRRDEELEADAHGIAIRARMMLMRGHAPLVASIARTNARQWTGWRLPYLCGGDLNTCAATLVARIKALLDE